MPAPTPPTDTHQTHTDQTDIDQIDAEAHTDRASTDRLATESTDAGATETRATPDRLDTTTSAPTGPSTGAPEPEADEPEPAPPDTRETTATPPAADVPADPQQSAEEPADEADLATAPEPVEAPATDTAPEKGKRGEKKRQPKPTVTPAEITRIVGTTSERALAYVRKPDPRLSRLPRKVRENVITEIPPVTAGALLGAAALARHFVASAATGRYRDLFFLWELFRTDPEACKPVLAERQEALAKGRASLETAVRLGLRGRTALLEEDIARAEGLIWQWMRSALLSELGALGARPSLASALLTREPGLEVPLPSSPNDRWLSEAAAAADRGELAPAVEKIFGAHLDRLPGTVATLSLAHERFPQQVEALIDRVDLGSPEIGALLAWARDHGQAERLRGRIAAQVEQEVGGGAQGALAHWWSWRERGVDLPLPDALRATSIDDLDLTRPETAELAAILVSDRAQIDVQGKLDALAGENRQLAEKAYEAFVCAGHEVHLPSLLRDNKMVKEGTRCPWCEAWTWVRPGHERRCPRARSGATPPPPVTAELADDWSVGTPATASSTPADASAAQPAAEADPVEGAASPES